MADRGLTVIIPCYNERNGIGPVIEEIHVSLAAFQHYEILVVDDGSTDGSREYLRELICKDRRVRLVEHRKNRGYGAALKTAIRKAQSELLAIIDADGSYPGAELPRLLALVAQNDMVVGARVMKGGRGPVLRRIARTILAGYASLLAGQRIPDVNSGLRVFRRSAVEPYLHLLPSGFSFTTTVTLALLVNQHDVSFERIDYRPRVGVSKIRPVRDMLNFLLLIARIGVYLTPLRTFLPAAFLLGVAFLASLCYDVFVLADLTEKTLLLLQLSLNGGMFALLGDMVMRQRLQRNDPAESGASREALTSRDVPGLPVDPVAGSCRKG